MFLTQRCVIQTVNLLGKNVSKNSRTKQFLARKALTTKTLPYPMQLVSKTCAGRWMFRSNAMLVVPTTGNLSKRKQIHSSGRLRTGPNFQQSESGAYEGTGKTTVTILNEDVQFVLVDSFSLEGFRLNNGLKGRPIQKYQKE